MTTSSKRFAAALSLVAAMQTYISSHGKEGEPSYMPTQSLLLMRVFQDYALLCLSHMLKLHACTGKWLNLTWLLASLSILFHASTPIVSSCCT